MRTTIFTSGLLLTTGVFAAPAPRPQRDNEITDSNPFDITKRLDVPDLGLPALPNVDSLTDKLPLKLPSILRRARDTIYGAVPVTTVASTIESTVVDKIPVKLPALPLRRRQLDGLDSITSILEPVLGGADVPSLPTLPIKARQLDGLDSVTSILEPVLGGAGVPSLPSLPTLPIKARQFDDPLSAISEIAPVLPTDIFNELPSLPIKARQLEGVTSAVTSAAGPIVNIAKPLLNTLLTSLVNGDAQIQHLINAGSKNAATIIATVESDLSGGIGEIQTLTATLESDASGAIDELQTLIGEIEASGKVLLRDIKKVESTAPSVATLISTVEGIISGVQGLGL